MTTLPLTCLVPVPGCFLGRELATCLRPPPASRKFTPASTSETGRKSSVGLETPPLVPLIPVGPWLQQAAELRASCRGVASACATTTADKGANERQKRDGAADARAANAERDMHALRHQHLQAPLVERPGSIPSERSRRHERGRRACRTNPPFSDRALRAGAHDRGGLQGL